MLSSLILPWLKAFGLEHNTYMVAIVASLLLNFRVKATTMITDTAQVKSCIKLARASSVP